MNGIIDLLLRDSGGYTVIDFKTDEIKSESQLTETLEKYTKQLEKYRRALNLTLGTDPRCMICFLDYCGEVILIPVGKDAVNPDEYDIMRDDWLVEAEEDDLYWQEPEFNSYDRNSMDASEF